MSPFHNVPVLVIGDVMLDHYVFGRAERVSPEAPVPVVDWEREEWRLGGAANVALNIKALGARPILVGLCGEDAPGERFCELLRSEGISSKYMVTDAARPTTVKTRFLAKNQQLLRLDRESTAEVSGEIQRKLLLQLNQALDAQAVRAIVFQDYNKGCLPLAVIREVLTEALRRDIPTVVDPKQRNFFEYRRATVFKPNLREVQTSLGLALRPDVHSLDAADKMLRQKLGNTLTVITLGEHGLYWSNGQGLSEIIPAHAIPVADVCGAGDTVVSVLAAGLGTQMPFGELARLANLAGGLACRRVGVVPVAWETISENRTNADMA